jgi:sarcosine oxidase, subunit beta
MANVIVPDGSAFPAAADVVIIGAGIVGAATAFFAAQAGMNAVVIERHEQPGTLATAASSECIRQQWLQPHNIDMMSESLHMIEHFADLLKSPGYDIGLHQQGYLFLTADERRAQHFEKLIARQRRFGLHSAELLSGAEVRRRFPWVGTDVVAGRFNQRDGWLAVHEMLWGFIKASQALYLVQTAATAIEQDSNGVCAVITERGRIATRRVVNAAGPFAGKVAAMAGVDLPLLNVRRQEVRISRHNVCPATAPMVVDDDTHVYWRPDGPAALLGGGETEAAPGEPLDQVPADWDFAAQVLEQAMRLSPFWEDVAESLKGNEVFLNAGQYSYVADRCPVIGATPVPGLYLNCAYDGHGIMGAPAGSRLLVDLMTERVREADNPFCLERLASGRHLHTEEAIL